MHITTNVDEVARLLGIKLWKFKRSIGFRVLRGVVEKTPVDTGRARAAWTIGAGQNFSPNPWQEGLKLTRGEASKMALGNMSNVTPVPPGGDEHAPIVVGNPVDYITVLEFGRDDGRPGSKQAPQGMVRVTLAELNSSLAKTIGTMGGEQ